MGQFTQRWTESTTPQLASVTVNGDARDSSLGGTNDFCYFNVYAFADVAGTVRIDVSGDGTNWRRATADAAVSAGGVQNIRVPVTMRYYRAVYVNGAGAQAAFLLATSFTAA